MRDKLEMDLVLYDQQRTNRLLNKYVGTTSYLKNIMIYPYFMPYAKKKFQINYRLNCKKQNKNISRQHIWSWVRKTRQNWNPKSSLCLIV